MRNRLALDILCSVESSNLIRQMRTNEPLKFPRQSLPNEVQSARYIDTRRNNTARLFQHRNRDFDLRTDWKSLHRRPDVIHRRTPKKTVIAVDVVDHDGVAQSAEIDGFPILEFPFSSTLCRSLVVSLTSTQYRYCLRHPEATVAALEALRASMTECEWQMSGYRWNCSGFKADSAATIYRFISRSPFDHPIAQKGYRESAFVHAILSAGLVTHVSRACSAGTLRSCGCLPEVDRRSSPSAWQQCESNVEYADNFARRFVERRYPVRANDLLYRIHSHNGRVGRRVVKSNSLLQCKCHGLSGSCQIKTCWKVAPSLRRVASILKQKYNDAILVGSSNSVQVVLTSSSTSVSVPRSSLAYFARSTSYCDRDLSLGVIGTAGRLCNLTVSADDVTSGSNRRHDDVGPDVELVGTANSCSSLCCGRGQVSTTVTSYRQCNCQFHWCCRVDCKQCDVTEVISVCQ